jgi:hypothetical protein
MRFVWKKHKKTNMASVDNKDRVEISEEEAKNLKPMELRIADVINLRVMFDHAFLSPMSADQVIVFSRLLSQVVVYLQESKKSVLEARSDQA